MADVKWIKLDTGLFDNRKIKHIRKLKDGDEIVLIWIFLLTLAAKCNAGGEIFLTEGVPYDADMIADEGGFKLSVVNLALAQFEKLNMISNSPLTVTDWNGHQSTDNMDKIREQNRARKARQRSQEKCDTERDMSRDSHVTERDSHAIEREEEREREEEKEKEYSSPSSSIAQNDFENLPKTAENVENPVENSGSKRQIMGGKLGQGLLLISDEQFDDLCDRLTLGEIEHYCEVIVNCERNGKHFAKSHYQAILDMAEKDRRKNERRK